MKNQVHVHEHSGERVCITDIPFDNLSRPDVANILRRYLDEKNTGQFGIYVGDEHQGHIEQIAERKI